jgi:hypothetical protein
MTKTVDVTAMKTALSPLSSSPSSFLLLIQIVSLKENNYAVSIFDIKVTL